MTVSANTDSHWSGSRRRSRGWAHLRGGSRNRALSGQGRPSRAGFRESGERSASAPQVCMRCDCKRQTVHVSVDCK
eukprot:3243265-Pleurochrysis_carterae.AAC.1